MRSTILALAMLLLTAPLAANARAGRDLVIPVAGRVDGINGSRWRTDIVVSNIATTGDPVPVGFTAPLFIRTFVEETLRPGETIVLRDALANWNRAAAGISYIRIGSDRGDAMLVAHARLYNVGGTAGEVGQVVHGIPVATLGRTAVVIGINGGAGTRTNIGYVDVEALDDTTTVTLDLVAGSGAVRVSRIHTVVGSFVQVNDLYTFLGVAPAEGDSLRIRGDGRIAAYASIALANGDADLIQSAAADVPTNEVVVPACATPAPLILARFRAPGHFVILTSKEGVAAETERLAAKYGFTPRSVYADVLGGFFALLTPEIIAALRCESDVQYISENSVGYIPIVP